MCMAGQTLSWDPSGRRVLDLNFQGVSLFTPSPTIPSERNPPAQHFSCEELMHGVNGVMEERERIKFFLRSTRAERGNSLFLDVKKLIIFIRPKLFIAQ